LGFSYVWNKKTDPENVHGQLDAFVDKYNPAYVRIVPDCQATYEEQVENNRVLGEWIGRWGSPYFYQAKHFEKPERCWWCYLKPFILHDGYVYPCSSVVLNSTSGYTFHKKFRWCHMDSLHKVYNKEAVAFQVEHCDHCVFKGQNDLIEELVYPNGMENFI